MMSEQQGTPTVKDNLSGLMKNQKTRSVVMFFGGALVLVLIAIVIARGRAQSGSVASASVPVAPQVMTDAGNTDVNPEYAQKIKEEDARRLGEAEKKGAGMVPSVLPSVAKPKAEEAKFEIGENKAAAKVAAPVGVNAPDAYTPAPQQARIDPKAGEMPDSVRRQLEALSNRWSWQGEGRTTQITYLDQPGSGAASQGNQGGNVVRGGIVAASGAGLTSGQPAVAGDSAATTGKDLGPRVIRAGQIYLATLDGAINTDVGGDVAATIRTGPAAGAQVIGKVTRKDELATVDFVMLSDAKYSQSMKITAVAVDAVNAGNGVASDVDTHLAPKLVAAFSISLLKGFSDAVKLSGTTQVSDNGQVTTTRPELSKRDQLLLAGGEVGNFVGKMLEPTLSRPPTVKAKRGDVIGIFFTQDVFAPNK